MSRGDRRATKSLLIMAKRNWMYIFKIYRNNKRSVMPAVKSRKRPKRSKPIEKTTTLSRWGNSLGLRIPQEGVDQLRLKEGVKVDMEIGEDVITIRPSKRRKKWTEAELLRGVTPDMCGPEIWSVPVGKEAF